MYGKTRVSTSATTLSPTSPQSHAKKQAWHHNRGVGIGNSKHTASNQRVAIMIGKRLQICSLVAVRCCSWSACDGEWTLIGLGASAVSMEGMACHLRRRAWPGAAGIGPATCKAEELQHIYYDRETSSGFACCGALLFMVGMRWRVDPDWTRGQSRANGRDGMPLEMAGVARSSRHRPGHLQGRRAATYIL